MGDTAEDDRENASTINALISELEDESKQLKGQLVLANAKLCEVQFELQHETSQHKSLQEQNASLEAQLREVLKEKEDLEIELSVAQDGSEDCGIKLNQVQEELERVQEELENFFFVAKDSENQLSRHVETVTMLRSQRKLLIRMVQLYGGIVLRLVAVDGRVTMPALHRQLQPWWKRFNLR